MTRCRRAMLARCDRTCSDSPSDLNMPIGRAAGGTWVGTFARARPSPAFVVAVVVFSFLPSIVHYGVSESGPFLFYFLFMIPSGLLGAILAKREAQGINIAFAKDQFPARLSVYGIVRHNWRSASGIGGRLWILLMIGSMVLTGYEWLVFGFSMSVSGPALATILYQLFPTILIVMLVWLPIELQHQRKTNGVRSKSERGQNLGIGRLILIGMAAFGVMITVASQNQKLSVVLEGNILGALLGLGNAVLVAASIALPLRLSRWMKLPDDYKTHGDKDVVFSCLALLLLSRQFLVCGMLVAPFAVVEWYQTSDGIGSLPLLMIVLGGAGIASAIGNYLYYSANQSSVRKPWINSLSNLTPVLALLWLWALVDMQIPRVAWFVLGALMIISANTLLHLDPEGAESDSSADAAGRDKVRGWAYRSLVLSILAAGVFMFFRDDWAASVMAAVEFLGVLERGSTVCNRICADSVV